jgi:hypothetical protein
MRIRYQIVLYMLVTGVAYFGARIVRTMFLNNGLERNICLHCGAVYIKTSSPQPLADLPFRIFGLIPFRCTVCGKRFYGARKRLQDSDTARLGQ